MARNSVKNWFMLSVRISSYGCTREVWRALKKLELLSAATRATLMLLSCYPNFRRASITRYTHAKHEPIGPLQDPVTWYGINYTGTQMTQWDFQNKGKSGWTGKSSFVLEVPLRYLRPSVIYSVPCDWILQRVNS